jgi:hypothetical protein
VGLVGTRQRRKSLHNLTRVLLASFSRPIGNCPQTPRQRQHRRWNPRTLVDELNSERLLLLSTRFFPSGTKDTLHPFPVPQAFLIGLDSDYPWVSWIKPKRGLLDSTGQESLTRTGSGERLAAGNDCQLLRPARLKNCQGIGMLPSSHLSPSSGYIVNLNWGMFFKLTASIFVRSAPGGSNKMCNGIHRNPCCFTSENYVFYLPQVARPWSVDWSVKSFCRCRCSFLWTRNFVTHLKCSETGFI